MVLGVVAQQALAWNVDALRRALAPRRGLLQDRQQAWGGAARFQPAPGLLGIGPIGCRVVEDGHLLGDPGQPPGLLELLLELFVNHAQMGDVGQGVGDLPFAERPTAPVGEAARLVDLSLGELGGERFVGRRLAVAADHCRDLGVEQGLRHLRHAQVEDFEILAGGVKDLQDASVGHQLVERGEVDALGQRVDRGGVLGSRHLRQAELGPVGALAHEFGVDGDEFGLGQGLAEGGEFVGRGDELHWERSIAGTAATGKGTPGGEAIPLTWPDNPCLLPGR